MFCNLGQMTDPWLALVDEKLCFTTHEKRTLCDQYVWPILSIQCSIAVMTLIMR